MTWIIRRVSEVVYIVEKGAQTMATITRTDEREWSVAFPNVRKLNVKLRNPDICTGYVRGIEAASTLIGNELRGLS